ncbi:MAG TPA: hypothetical protein PLU80_22815 [Acidobacteriota bacterium]|nr:hypothetical protein [Acidobacteriota bacterium]
MVTQDPEPAEPAEVESCDEPTPYNKEEETFLSEIKERVLVGIQAESDLSPDETDDWEPPVQAEESVFWVDGLTTQTENEITDSGELNPDEFSGNAVNSDSLTTLENELELPPGTFQNELKFICEEPKETRRAFARERYQKLRDHLEKCAPNFGFSELRWKFRSIFGGAICDLLEKVDVPLRFTDKCYACQHRHAQLKRVRKCFMDDTQDDMKEAREFGEYLRECLNKGLTLDDAFEPLERLIAPDDDEVRNVVGFIKRGLKQCLRNEEESGENQAQ